MLLSPLFQDNHLQQTNLITFPCQQLYQPWTHGYPCRHVVPDEKGGTPKFEHHSLVLLEMAGYELEEDIQAVQYIKLIAERAVRLKRVHLLQQFPKVTRCSCIRCACLTIDERSTVPACNPGAVADTRNKIKEATRGRAVLVHRSNRR